MILSDKDIKRAIINKKIQFFPKIKEDQIGPASVDLRLDNKFKFFRPDKFSVLDLKKPLPKHYMEVVELKNKSPLIIHPGNFVLASTKEYIKLSDNMAARVEGKSSLGRMGILIHTAGFIDPGFEGSITLEISNQANVAVALYPEMYICQISLEMLSSPAVVPYNKRKKSLYLKQKGPTEGDVRNLF